MSAPNPQVDAYLTKADKWRNELKELRKIVLQCPLDEELKWGKPCYTYDGANIVLLMGFKEHCVLLFCKGALLKDPERILVQPGENSQSARQARFKSVTEIAKAEPVLKRYLQEAIAAERAGLKVTYKKPSELALVEELQAKLNADRALKAAFEALTPGRRRAYHLYVSGAKQSKTREARVEKCVPRILAGKGLND